MTKIVRELAARRPRDEAGLASTKGFGQAKLERFASEILTLLSEGDPDPV